MDTIRQNETPANADAVGQVLAEEQKLVNENRRQNREPLVVPVEIYQDDFDLTVSGFARNISTSGICLIAPQPFREGTEVTMRLLGEPTRVESTGTCCWGTKFGSTYWLSGWRIDQQLPVAQILKEDLLVEPEHRTGNRVTTAIPVYVTLSDSSTRVPGFTRNLSRDGICLVSKIGTTSGQHASLEVMRPDGGSSVVESRCLWSKQYGEAHWVSGWDFQV